jgi:hypothetical protein
MNNLTLHHLQQEYETQKALFENQPPIVQRFLESQAQVIVNALISKASQVRFALPDRVVTRQDGTITIPESQRQNVVGGFLQRDVREKLIQRLNELEKSSSQAIAIGTGLLRYATAVHMVYNLLPAGRAVIYRPDGDEQIPTIPVEDNALESAVTQASDAIVEDGSDDQRGDLQTPFVPAARKFFLPQWVAFDDAGKLLVGSLKEALCDDPAPRSVVCAVYVCVRGISTQTLWDSRAIDQPGTRAGKFQDARHYSGDQGTRRKASLEPRPEHHLAVLP